MLGVTARRLTPEELDTAFQAVKALTRDFPVLNPVASIEDMQRHLRGEPETFGCLAGWKSFYLDWHLQLWRCHNWDRPLCDIRDFNGTQRVRDGCTACMIDCYRDDSVMQHVGLAISDGVQAAARGDFRQAWHHWTDGRNVISARAAIRTARAWASGGGKRFKQPTPPEPAREGPDADADDQLLSLSNEE